MSAPAPKRMSQGVKLAIMGVGAAALLYSCAPAIGAVGALPFLWGFGNPFYRGPVAPNCGPAVPGAPACAPNQSSSGSGSGSGFRSGSSSSTTSSTTSGSSSAGQSTSSRGGFGSSAASHGASGSS